MFASGHPAPCDKQYWVNARLLKPVVDTNGCDSFANGGSNHSGRTLGVGNRAEP